MCWIIGCCNGMIFPKTPLIVDRRWPLTCRTTNFRLHLLQILRKVSQAMSWGQDIQTGVRLWTPHMGESSMIGNYPHANKATSLSPPSPQSPPYTHLHSRVCLVHELEQLVDDRLEELPVGSEELGVLTHHVPEGTRWGGVGGSRCGNKYGAATSPLSHTLLTPKYTPNPSHPLT